MNQPRQEQVIDYVLQLLPADQAQAVRQAALKDAELRGAIHAERELIQAARITIGRATAPAPGQLRRFRPSPVQPPSWSRALTLAGAFVLLILVAFGWHGANSLVANPGTDAPGVAITITQTEAPTITLTHTLEANGALRSTNLSLMSTRIVWPPADSGALPPFAIATPIAALSFPAP